MALIRLAFAADLPTPDEALRMLAGGEAPAAGAPRPASARGGGAQRAALAEPQAAFEPSIAAPAPAGPKLQSFLDVVRLADAKRDAKLKVELESYVHLIGFEPGRIELRLHDRAPSDLANRLMQRLKEWSGRQWIVSVNAQEEGRETLRDARTAEVLAHPMVKKALELFPGAEIVAIRDPKPQASEAETQAGPDVVENESE
jgi:DNA polymerase-3 subunit gamma/tau